MADTACPISAGTWNSALWSAWSAAGAAEAVMAGSPSAYALCRPPGHHAFADLAGGFCFINNSAVAAQVLRRSAAHVAILDVDLHHGNGTQGIFYARPDVLTISLHADPVRFYPFFWGHADERGDGPGLGYNLNLPLPRKSGDEAFLQALATPFRRIAQMVNSAILAAVIPKTIKPHTALTDADYKELLELAFQQGALAHSEKEIILQIIQLDRRTAKDVMKPRSQMPRYIW